MNIDNFAELTGDEHSTLKAFSKKRNLYFNRGGWHTAIRFKAAVRELRGDGYIDSDNNITDQGRDALIKNQAIRDSRSPL